MNNDANTATQLLPTHTAMLPDVMVTRAERFFWALIFVIAFHRTFVSSQDLLFHI